MQRLVGRQVARIARLGQRTPGVQIGQENLLGRVHNLGRFGHEMNAAEKDDVGLRRLRLIGKSERITYVIRDLLDLLHLVIVRENDGILLLLQRQYVFLQGTHPLTLADCTDRVYRGE
jgi:hypothetical protein